MTAPTLLSDKALRWALAGPAGVPTSVRDERLDAWYAAGLIEPYGDVWRLNLRVPSQLTPEQREAIRDDQVHVRLADV